MPNIAAALSALAMLAVAPASRARSDCADCPQMMPVPAGSFTMTVPLGRIDGPPGAATPPVPTGSVRITIARPFRIASTEVTVAQYAAFVAATRRPDPDRCFVFETIEASGKPVFGWRSGASWRAPGYPQTAIFPATCIRWIDATAYAAWLSTKTGHRYRLPSEAEWEFAARGGEAAAPVAGSSCAIGNGADRTLKRAYPGLAAFEDCDDGALFAAPVAHYRPNALGLYDMKGNLWEWTADCDHRSYAGMPADGRAWIEGGDCNVHVRRGGSWYRASGDDRSGLPAGDAHGNAGFRVVEEVE